MLNILTHPDFVHRGFVKAVINVNHCADVVVVVAYRCLYALSCCRPCRGQLNWKMDWKRRNIWTLIAMTRRGRPTHWKCVADALRPPPEGAAVAPPPPTGHEPRDPKGRVTTPLHRRHHSTTARLDRTRTWRASASSSSAAYSSSSFYPWANRKTNSQWESIGVICSQSKSVEVSRSHSESIGVSRSQSESV